MREQQQQELSLDTEIQGFKKDITKEQVGFKPGACLPKVAVIIECAQNICGPQSSQALLTSCNNCCFCLAASPVCLLTMPAWVQQHNLVGPLLCLAASCTIVAVLAAANSTGVADMQLRNEQLTAVVRKVEGESDFVSKQISIMVEKQDRLSDQLEKLSKSLEQTEDRLKRANLEAKVVMTGGSI